MKQSEVIGFLHYPEDVCQHFNSAKWPPFKKNKPKEPQKNPHQLCFDKIMICREELLKKHVHHFHSVLLNKTS